MSLSKEEKKALIKAYMAKQNKKYVLKKNEAKSLFNYITKQISNVGCDHTLKHTEAWLAKKFEDEDKRQLVLKEIAEDGGFCDCEVVMNCYERYDLEF